MPHTPRRRVAFDKACGTDIIRKLTDEQKPTAEILAAWREGVDAFRKQREPYLLYK